MESGVVYIFSNPSLAKDILKVGMTTRTAMERAKEISKHAGVPREYEVVWEKYVPNVALAENVLHYFLHKYSYNKEFFMLSEELAVLICEEVITRVFEPLNIKELNEHAKRKKRLEKLDKELAQVAIDLEKALEQDKMEPEIEDFIKEKKNGISIIPVGNKQTNWESVAESLPYNFGKEAINLILKEGKKGDPMRRRFLQYRRGYYSSTAIHLFFTPKHLSVYVTGNTYNIESALKRRFKNNFNKLCVKPVLNKGVSFIIADKESFQILKKMLKIGERGWTEPPIYE